MVLISLAAAILVWIFFYIFITPKQKKHIEKMQREDYEAKVTCLDRIEKKLGWDAETRAAERERKRLDEEEKKMEDMNAKMNYSMGNTK
jgi:DNA-binding MarR family transcriptional regulator